MPELPEVEVTRRGIAAPLQGRTLHRVVVRNAALRWPVPDCLHTLAGQTLLAVDRRAKYLLLRFAHGTLIMHLGMSGSLRVLERPPEPGKHDHLDLCFDGAVLRLRDPRRFGAVLWHDGPDDTHPLLAHLGPEPLSTQFNGTYLKAALIARRVAIKQAIMDATVVVGVGNIYASESLFRAGIRPSQPAGRLSAARCTRLVTAIKDTLQEALRAGGSTLRDFAQADGEPGYFQQQYFAYGRAGQPCRICGATVRVLRMAQRSTFWCPDCQH